MESLENGENILKLRELARYFSAWLIDGYFYYTTAFPVGISCLGFGHCFMLSVDFGFVNNALAQVLRTCWLL